MAWQKILAILTGTDIVRLVNELISKVLRNIIFDKFYRGTARLIKVYIRFPWTLKAHYEGGRPRKDFSCGHVYQQSTWSASCCFLKQETFGVFLTRGTWAVSLPSPHAFYFCRTHCLGAWNKLAWENNRRFPRSPLEPSQSDFWVASEEVPCWRRSLPRSCYCFWLLERKFPRGTTNQKHYQDLGSARHQYGVSALVARTSFCGGSGGDLAKRRLFS